MESGYRRLCCQICGENIPPGGIFYIGRTEIISGSDGILLDTGEMPDRMIEKALHEITRARSEKELMDEVYQEIRLIFCGRCRFTFRDGILDMVKY